MKPVTAVTPLHWAAYNDDPNTVAFLLDKNAKITFNNQGSSPIDMAGLVNSFKVTYFILIINRLLESYWKDGGKMAKDL